MVAPPAVITETTGGNAIVIKLLCRAIAPARERALPKRVEPSNKLIAPSATIVPLNTELFPKSNCPPTCQYTLHKEAELMRTTFEKVPVDNAPFILRMNNAFGLPCPSRVKVPFNVEADPRQYTFGVRIWPLPKVVPITAPQVTPLR